MDVQLDLEQWVVFAIADYHFALPIQDVFQVVNCHHCFNDGLQQIGLAQMGHHVIQLLDLHQQLHLRVDQLNPEAASFFVVIHDSHGKLYGIPVHEAPDLVDVTPDLVRSLPRSVHQPDVWNIASQLILLPWQGTTKAVLLLDLNQVLQRSPASSPALLQAASSEDRRRG